MPRLGAMAHRRRVVIEAVAHFRRVVNSPALPLIDGESRLIVLVQERVQPCMNPIESRDALGIHEVICRARIEDV